MNKTAVSISGGTCLHSVLQMSKISVKCHVAYSVMLLNHTKQL